MGTPHFAHSGQRFEDTVVFGPNSPLSIPVVGLIVNDDFALEDIEVFDLVFENPIPSPSQNDLIHIGSPTEVRITSEDGKTQLHYKVTDTILQLSVLPLQTQLKILMSMMIAHILLL